MHTHIHIYIDGRTISVRELQISLNSTADLLRRGHAPKLTISSREHGGQRSRRTQLQTTSSGGVPAAETRDSVRASPGRQNEVLAGNAPGAEQVWGGLSCHRQNGPWSSACRASARRLALGHCLQRSITLVAHAVAYRTARDVASDCATRAIDLSERRSKTSIDARLYR